METSLIIARFYTAGEISGHDLGFGDTLTGKEDSGLYPRRGFHFVLVGKRSQPGRWIAIPIHNEEGAGDDLDGVARSVRL
jgi:hypothetical protein